MIAAMRGKKLRVRRIKLRRHERIWLVECKSNVNGALAGTIEGGWLGNRIKCPWTIDSELLFRDAFNVFFFSVVLVLRTCIKGSSRSLVIDVRRAYAVGVRVWLWKI
jgi:hypothetical protein